MPVAGHGEFFAISAQVIPVLLLALVWETGYLSRLATTDLSERRFWTKGRIRLWSQCILPYSIAMEALALAVLANWVPDNGLFVVLVAAGLVGLLATLLVRMLSDVTEYTK